MNDSREGSWKSRSEGGSGVQPQQSEGANLRSMRSLHALILFADPPPSLPWGQFLLILLSLGRF